MLEFWRWAVSDLLANTTRGVLAEYLVATALGSERRVRVEWDAFDLVMDGRVRIEVKSAATWQTWAQRRPSPLSFGIAPTLGWEASTNTTSPSRRRQADVYVFAVLDAPQKTDADPRDVSMWTFYVLAATLLDLHCGEQKSIGINRIRALGAEPIPFGGLRREVERVAPAL